ncbi:hypothetical protein EV652_111236 [Kribbella steppae]|uniref:Uncharacterized protein n=1 Tax=Kribbella steppae TaxID=2512223 RepID=A0A4R2H697_9ACTN|nr:hypothetical protein [Kribbella steppae]TCO21325.1 hypothetical protein EV652_111236 [Kribbella steppae]
MPAALLLRALLAPRLLLVGATALLLRTLTPTATLGRLALTGLPLALAGTGSSGLALAGLSRLAGLRSSGLLLAPTAALLRRLALLGRLLGLLGALTPTATTTLAGRLLTPTALASLSPLLPARLAPRLPRTPRSLRRRRHIRSF